MHNFIVLIKVNNQDSFFFFFLEQFPTKFPFIFSHKILHLLVFINSYFSLHKTSTSRVLFLTTIFFFHFLSRNSTSSSIFVFPYAFANHACVIVYNDINLSSLTRFYRSFSLFSVSPITSTPIPSATMSLQITLEHYPFHDVYFPLELRLSISSLYLSCPGSCTNQTNYYGHLPPEQVVLNNSSSCCRTVSWIYLHILSALQTIRNKKAVTCLAVRCSKVRSFVLAFFSASKIFNIHNSSNSIQHYCNNGCCHHYPYHD